MISTERFMEKLGYYQIKYDTMDAVEKKKLDVGLGFMRYGSN